MPRIVLLGLIAFSLAASLIGLDPKARPVDPDAARCPLIYAPVICDHGKIYPNQCVADQHHAKNCVPYGL